MTTLAILAAKLGLDIATPAAVCAPDRALWYAQDPAAIEPLSALVDAQVQRQLDEQSFGHGHSRFDGEWWFGTYMMAAAGFGRAALLDPDRQDENARRARDAVTLLLRLDVRRFDTAAWGSDMLEDLDRDEHDHAVLGYLGVALGLERLADSDGPHATLHDAVASALSRRLSKKAPGSLLQTYPGETYPVDNAAVVAAIALHAQATGAEPPPWLGAWLKGFEARWVDAETGLLIQAVDPERERPRDHARGSGTALGSWFLSFADPALAARLGRATRDGLGERWAGHALVREYPRGVEGRGDIDSGPLVLGYSISASGFAIGAARAAGDGEWQADLLDTACLFAAETDGVGGSITGGPLGNAILLAMLTTPGP